MDIFLWILLAGFSACFISIIMKVKNMKIPRHHGNRYQEPFKLQVRVERAGDFWEYWS